MPQISSIEPQKKRKGRFNIFLDGKFAFGADESFLVKNHLQIGQELTGLVVEKYIKETELTKLFDASLRFLSFRPRSEKEVGEYLAKKISQKEGIKYQQAKESGQITQVIDKLKRYRYLDDLDFAKWWITARLKSNPKGQLFMKYELLKKGIAADIIENVLSRLPKESSLAQKALEKKLKIWKNLPPKELKRKTYVYLRARGFSYDTVEEVFAFLQRKS